MGNPLGNLIAPCYNAVEYPDWLNWRIREQANEVFFNVF